MDTESLVDSQPSKDLGVNSSCIEPKDSGAGNSNQSNISAQSDCMQAMSGGMSNDIYKLVEMNGQASSGCKRARVSSEDYQAAVHVKYEFLSRESKKKLEELLSEWSKWHAAHCASSKNTYDALESGGETYYPALQCGAENSSVSFLMETQAMKKQKTDSLSLKCDSVPLYDRDYEFALKFTNGSNEDSVLSPLNASRCFNCGTYGHSLKECPKPRDSLAVSNARKEHQLKKNQNGGTHVLTRYYQNTPRGKYDGLKPGALDTETRKRLGLVELDPPPWLNRMCELGYPPGYLDVEDSDQPSGITIFDDDESCQQKEITEKVDVTEPGRTRSVSFPGINAPIPENADQSQWAASPLHQTINYSGYHSNQWSNFSAELPSRGNAFSQRQQSDNKNGFFSSYAQEAFSQRQQSDNKNGFFSSYAQELDSLLSNYSGYSHYTTPDYAANSDSTLSNGFSRLRGQHTPGLSPRDENYASSHSSGSNLMAGFSGGRRVHQFDVRPGHSPSASSYSPFGISPNQYAYSRQF